MATPKGGVSSNVSDEEFLPITNVSGIDPLLWPPQEQGQFALDQNLTNFLGLFQFAAVHSYSGHSRNLMSFFRSTRDAKVQRIAVETNRLLVRLEKVTE